MQTLECRRPYIPWSKYSRQPCLAQGEISGCSPGMASCGTPCCNPVWTWQPPHQMQISQQSSRVPGSPTLITKVRCRRSPLSLYLCWIFPFLMDLQHHWVERLHPAVSHPHLSFGCTPRRLKECAITKKWRAECQQPLDTAAPTVLLVVWMFDQEEK